MSRSNPSLEVVASYQGTVLDVQHLRPGTGSGRYTVGEGDRASFAAPPVDLLTPEGFELARIGRGGACWIRFTADMHGQIAAKGRRYTLQEWMAAGWTVVEDGAHGTTLPPGARCVLRHGELTFHLAAVESPIAPTSRPEFDRPFWSICAATFAVLTSLLVLAHFAAPPAAHLDLEEHAHANRFVGYFRAADTVRKPKPTRPSRPRAERTPTPESPAATPTRRTPPQPTAERQPLTEPSSQAPTTASTTGRRARGTSKPIRSQDSASLLGRGGIASAAYLMKRGDGPIERARRAGIIAYVDTTPLVDNEYAGAFSPDVDDRAMWEAQKAIDPTTRSVAGLDLIGKGRGGGPGSTDDMVTSEPKVEQASEDGPRSLVVRAGSAKVRGPRARDAVRSVVVRHIRDLRRCYDKGVDRDPDLSGSITLELEIDAAGDVLDASASRFSDPAVGDCMAAAAKGWRFGEVDRRARSRARIPLTLRLR